MEANSVDSIVTDPPYGISYKSNRRKDKSQQKDVIANDGNPFIWFLFDAARVLKEGGCLVLFCEWKHSDVFRMAIEVAGLKVKSQAIWDRDWHGMGDLKGSFAPMHDVIWFAVKGEGFRFPGKRPKSVLRHRRIGGDQLLHPTEKPVSLMAELVESVTPKGGVVLDPFAGSGATCVAAKMCGFDFIGVELDEKYAKIASDRVLEQRVNNVLI